MGNGVIMATIEEILRMPLSEREKHYKAIGIDRVIIDGNVFTDYGAFSFLWEKSYVKSPVRAGNGSIGNLDSYATFITPHLKINFSLLSIDSYRMLMKLLYSKNEHTVTCYDIVYNTITTNNMYFSTEEMPTIYAMARGLSGEEYVELLGVLDYTIEMVGTNTNVATAKITYNLNPPTSWSGETTVSVDLPINLAQPVGDNAIITVGENPTRISEIKFNGYKFKYWCENANGEGFKYLDTDAYMFREDTTLYAIWGKSA